MKVFIKLIGIIMLLSGTLLLINPDILFDWIVNKMESKSFYIFAIVGRLVLGATILITAKESRFPMALKLFGYLAIITAVVFIFIGHDSFLDFLSSLIPGIRPYAFLSGLIAIAIGGFLIYAYTRKKDQNI